MQPILATPMSIYDLVCQALQAGVTDLSVEHHTCSPTMVTKQAFGQCSWVYKLYVLDGYGVFMSTQRWVKVRTCSLVLREATALHIKLISFSLQCVVDMRLLYLVPLSYTQSIHKTPD